MLISSLLDLTDKKAKLTFFIFSGLLLFSASFFVFAENNTTSQTLFNDSDQDGLANDEEKLYGTDPMNKDTDGDGYGDGIEVNSGYNPLKPAPGDKIITDETKELSSQTTPQTTTYSDSSSENLTEKTSNEIALIIQNTQEDGSEISMDDINNSVEKVLSGNTEEIVLPEINIKDIKIKKIKKGLSERKRLEQEKQDVLEYLTVLSYLVANNSPKSFQTIDDLNNLFNTLSLDSLSGLASGKTNSFDDIAERGEKMLKELKSIEVPESMIDIHVKALKMALYGIQLKDELKPTGGDPLGQIAVLSKAQGFFSNITNLADEVQEKLTAYGIEEIPLTSL